MNYQKQNLLSIVFFTKVDFGWSPFMDCKFLETSLDDSNFEVVSNPSTSET